MSKEVKREGAFAVADVVKILIYVEGQDEPLLIEHKRQEAFDAIITTIKTPVIQ